MYVLFTRRQKNGEKLNYISNAQCDVRCLFVHVRFVRTTVYGNNSRKKIEILNIRDVE
jgi:hypothetical protein